MTAQTAGPVREHRTPPLTSTKTRSQHRTPDPELSRGGKSVPPDVNAIPVTIPRGNRVPNTRGSLRAIGTDLPRTDEIPEGAEASGWRTAGRYGTDGYRTWHRTDDGWVPILDAAVEIPAERVPAPDPDFPDRSTDGEDDALAARADVVVRYRRAGRIRERTYHGMTTKRIRECAALDMAGPSAWRGADLSQGGRARIAGAALALADPATAEFYAVAGWHPAPPGVPGSWFVHGGGVIGTAGTVPDAEVDLGDPLAALALGDPAGDIRAAIEATAALVTTGAMPGRVAWPTVGAALRPLFGVYRDPLDAAAEVASAANAWLSGPFGAAKTGALAAGANVLYPGLTHTNVPIKAGTSKGTGSSRPGLERMGFRARDLCLPIDDLDPSEPASVRAAWQSDLARAAYGQTARIVATRGGTGNRAALPFRAGFIGTGEPLDSEASAANRMINIPIDHGDIRVTALADCTTPEARQARGALGAVIVRTMATDRAEYRTRLDLARAGLRPMFAARSDDVPGPLSRMADVMTEAAATLYAALTIAVDHGMTRHDARALWHGQIIPALAEAWRSALTVVDAGDRGGRAIVYLGEALRAGEIRIDALDAPGTVSRDAYGWEPGEVGPGGPEWRPARGATRAAGYQDPATGDLYLLPSITTGTVRRVAEAAGDPWSGGTRDLASALRAGGYLRVAPGRAARGEATVRPRVAGRQVDTWHLPSATWEARQGAGYAGRDYSGPVDMTALPYLDGPAPEVAPVTDDPRPAPQGPQDDAQGPAGPWVIGGPRPVGARRIRPDAAEPITLDAAEVQHAARVIRERWPEAAEADIRAAVVAMRTATAVPGSTALGAGVRMHGDPGWVGVQWLRAVLARGRGPVMTPIDTEGGPLGAILTGGRVFRFADQVWPGRDLAEGDRVTALDVHGAWPAAAASLPVGLGEPITVAGPDSLATLTDDPRWTTVPGYATLAAPLALRVHLPALAALGQGDVLPLPWLDLACRPGTLPAILAAPPALAEVTYWPEHTRRLDAWQRHVSRARAALLDVPGTVGEYARALLKRIYVGAFTYLRSDRHNHQREWYRPDVSDMLVSRAGANLLRKILDGMRAGVVPLGMFRDDVWYLADDLAGGALDAHRHPTDLGKLGERATVTASADLAAAYAEGQSYAMVQAMSALIRGAE